MECYPEKIFESEILSIVTEAIRQQARCVVDAQHMMEQQKKSQEATVALLRKKVKKLEALQRELAQKIEKLYEDYFSYGCVGLLNLFLAQALRAAHNAIALYRYEEYSKQDFDFVLVLQYIQQNYRTVSLAELGRTFHFDEKYLSKLIQKNMGQNFIGVLRTVKMNHAVNCLTNTSMSVRKIAEAVGYDSADYFSRAFRRMYGMSPHQYRKRQAAGTYPDDEQ